MVRSITLMVTGGSLIPRTHAASQGAGQMRPVNSGKLLVECSTRIAAFHRSRYTRSFQSGMMLFSGQPVWQKGTPQSMQRAPVAESLNVLRLFHALQIHAGLVAARLDEIARLIENICNPARHSRGEILSRVAQADDQTLSHVLAAVIADALDHGGRARI